MRFLARWNLGLHSALRSPILGYSFSAVCVAIALGLALALRHYDFRDTGLPLLVLSVALVCWYAGPWPSLLAFVLAAPCFIYFFVEPFYSFDVDSRDIPYIVLFLSWTLIVASFAAVRRQVEDDLRQARDHLLVEVEQRKEREAEIERLNQELVKRATELEATNKELESFAYSVSHDLRAPLRHVIGYGELLQKQGSSLLDDRTNRYVRMILESAKRMGNLIDDLLGFSRIGRAETRKTAVDLEQLVREVVAEFGQETSGRDIAWKIAALPICYGDRSMLKLALVNLISNAVKFTRMRTQAEIEIGCTDGREDRAELFVRDNGAGFDMRYVNKLFGVFQRLHLPEEFEGTGIGLATVHRIVLRHEGQIRAEGAVDQGATFYFSLPKVQASEKRARSTL